MVADCEQPTDKQLNFIKVVEEKWGYLPFEGNTKEQATEYISNAIKENNRDDFETEAMNFSYPDR